MNDQSSTWYITHPNLPPFFMICISGCLEVLEVTITINIKQH